MPVIKYLTDPTLGGVRKHAERETALMMPIFAEDISFLSYEIEHRNDSRWLLSPAPRAWLVLRNLFLGFRCAPPQALCWRPLRRLSRFDTGLKPGVNEMSHFPAF